MIAFCEDCQKPVMLNYLDLLDEVATCGVCLGHNLYEYDIESLSDSDKIQISMDAHNAGLQRLWDKFNEAKAKNYDSPLINIIEQELYGKREHST